MLFSNYQSDINGWLSCKTTKEKKNEKTVCPKTFSTLPFHKNKINWYKSVFSVFSISWYLIYPRILICTLYWEKEYTFTLVLLFTVVVGFTVIDVWTKRPSKFIKMYKGVLCGLTISYIILQTQTGEAVRTSDQRKHHMRCFTVCKSYFSRSRRTPPKH